MKRILIIEDDPAISKGLQESLEDEHYDVIVADDGQNGYNLALKKKPDLILLDLMLPTMNGQDICRKLREDGLTMPILMLTSKIQDSDRFWGMKQGADGYMTKPFEADDLVQKVEELL